MRDERRERYCTGTKKRQRKTEIQSKSRDFFVGSAPWAALRYGDAHLLANLEVAAIEALVQLPEAFYARTPRLRETPAGVTRLDAVLFGVGRAWRRRCGRDVGR
jgi:hypothetical protein